MKKVKNRIVERSDFFINGDLDLSNLGKSLMAIKAEYCYVLLLEKQDNFVNCVLCETLVASVVRNVNHTSCRFGISGLMKVNPRASSPSKKSICIPIKNM